MNSKIKNSIDKPRSLRLRIWHVCAKLAGYKYGQAMLNSICALRINPFGFVPKITSPETKAENLATIVRPNTTSP